MTDLVKNAADPEQVKRAGRKTKDRAALELADMRVVMSTPHGRRFVRRLLAQHAVYASITSVDALRMAAASGRRDAGLELLATVVQDEALYDQMEREHRQDSRREAAGNDASRTPSATEENPST